MTFSDSISADPKRGVGIQQSVSSARSGKSNDNDNSRELRQACQDFEEIFLRLVLKEAKINKSMFEGEGAFQVYGDLTRETLAKAMAQAGGLGLADVLYQQLSKDQSASGISPPEKSANLNHPIEGK